MAKNKGKNMNFKNQNEDTTEGLNKEKNEELFVSEQNNSPEESTQEVPEVVTKEPTSEPKVESELPTPPVPPHLRPEPVHLEDIVDYGESNVPANFDYSILTNRDIQFEYQGHTVNAPVIQVEQKQNESTGRLDTKILVKTNNQTRWYDVDGKFKLIKY